MWSEMTKILPWHVLFFSSNPQHPIAKSCFPCFHLVYFSGWKASLSHAQGCFLVASVMGQSTNISWLWAGVNMLEKSLKSVKNKTKSMSVSLSVSLPPLPHVCPLLFFFSLTPPQFLQTLRNDSPQDQGWTGYESTSGGGGGGGSHPSGVSTTSRPASPQRQDHVSCSLCSAREGSVKSPDASVSQVNTKTTRSCVIRSDLLKRKS